MPNHLRSWHKGCKNRQTIIDEFGALPIAASITELTPSADGSPPFSFLLPPQPGYCCPECISFQTISWVEFRKHRKKSHFQTTSGLKIEDMSSHPQRRTIGRVHHCSQYWINVIVPDSGQSRALVSRYYRIVTRLSSFLLHYAYLSRRYAYYGSNCLP
jgi:hypothetical protein